MVLGHDECFKILESQRLRFLEEKNAKLFSGWNKTMQYFFPDTGEYFHFVFANGKPGELTFSQVNNPEIEYRMDTDTFKAITERTLDPIKAWQQGKVKLKAALPDMLKLQKLS
ncbi:MAG: hypothetical protein EHM28_09995 [Spirochaetaceae bacterium]|nr:MAG: hypothetical protein EHM28_09995 [Spirochaetaceae bacterium]